MLHYLDFLERTSNRKKGNARSPLDISDEALPLPLLDVKFVSHQKLACTSTNDDNAPRNHPAQAPMANINY